MSTMQSSTTIPAWVASYIGVPFRDRGRSREGWDCWGCLMTALNEQHGIVLPSYDGRYAKATDHLTVAKLFFEESLSGRWRRVDLGEIRPPDVLTLSVVGARHVALMVTRDRLLHVLPGRETCVERLYPHWAPRVDACYRHEALAHG